MREIWVLQFVLAWHCIEVALLGAWVVRRSQAQGTTLLTRKENTNVSQMVQSCHDPRYQLLRCGTSSLPAVATRSTRKPRRCILCPIRSSWRLFVRLAGIRCCLYSSKAACWLAGRLDGNNVGLEFGICFDWATYRGATCQSLFDWVCWVLDGGEPFCGWGADIGGSMDETSGG